MVRQKTPTLIAVAHGTQDPNGLAEIRRLINIVRTKRPELAIEMCWLDGAAPTLAAQLPTVDGPAVVVPILLSTGYHVKADIPAIVGDRPATAISPPLGPDPRISRVVYLRRPVVHHAVVAAKPKPAPAPLPAAIPAAVPAPQPMTAAVQTPVQDTPASGGISPLSAGMMLGGGGLLTALGFGIWSATRRRRVLA